MALRGDQLCELEKRDEVTECKPWQHCDVKLLSIVMIAHGDLVLLLKCFKC